jgi:hypothetical protein
MPKRTNEPTTLLRKESCATCPWRDGSPYAYLRADLEASALTERNRICHSTGSNAINRRTGKPEAVCRGARDAQLRVFTALGFLSESTDEAWAEARVRCGMKPETLI